MQNLQDLEGIVETIHDRLDTLERHQHLHAQSIAHAYEEASTHRAHSKVMHDDFEAYKKFITGTHVNIDACVKGNVWEIQAKLDYLHALFSPVMDTMVSRMQMIEDTLTAMSMDAQAGAQRLRPPVPPGIPPQDAQQNIVMHTPVREDAQPVPEYVSADPWHQAAAQRRAERAAPEAAPTGAEYGHMPRQMPGADFPTPDRIPSANTR